MTEEVAGTPEEEGWGGGGTWGGVTRVTDLTTSICSLQ